MLPQNNLQQSAVLMLKLELSCVLFGKNAFGIKSFYNRNTFFWMTADFMILHSLLTYIYLLSNRNVVIPVSKVR